jgi:hypothetical protein
LRLNIKWSKQKQIIEDRICDSLKKRIKIHLTHYRAVHEPESRFWITFDDKEVFSVSKLKWLSEWAKIRGEYIKNQGTEDPYYYAEKVMHSNGKYYIDHIQESLEQYINTSIEEALVSDNFIIKALAMIDKRLGKRRLTNMNLDEKEHLLVKKLFEMRCETEKINRNRRDGSS